MTFLTAEWRHLLMANMPVPADVLLPYVPRGCELEPYQGKYYVSLVAFRFLNTRVCGLPIPWHRNFDEVNIRFYVMARDAQGELQRGVVFIREFVPRFMIACIARTLFREPYRTASMSSTIEDVAVSYSWNWQGASAIVESTNASHAMPLDSSPEAHFFSEHYVGFTRYSAQKTIQYQVTHDQWRYYPVTSYRAEGNWYGLYPPEFAPYLDREPESVFLFEGSPITVSWHKDATGVGS